jgi:outer membrane protein assembly factor BamB/serine/threonine protein kinase
MMMVDYLERIGQIVGDYRLLRWLGGGSFGNVYLAEHIRNGDHVAVKLLQVRLTAADDLRAFINEARTMRLRHPHIVPLLDFGLSQDDAPFLVMDYAPKGTLRDRFPRGTRLPLALAVDYTVQAASALQYAHEQHIVHRDVKPENMLMRDDDMLLLSDFGIATATYAASYSTRSPNATGQGITGTAPYIAPEQLEGQPRPQSDQYALAVVLYEWLAGRCPFQGTIVEIAIQHAMKQPPPLRDQVAGLPLEVEEVLFKALAKDPHERFPSMQAFAMTLQQASNLASPHQSLFSSPPKTMPGGTVQTPRASFTSGATQLTKQPERQATMFGLNTHHTHHNPYEHTVNIATISRLRVAWAVPAGGIIDGTPTIANDLVYVGSKDGKLYAFDAFNGQRRWNALTGDSIYSSPAIADDIVYISSYDRKLYAFDASNGQRRWAAQTGAPLYSSPAIANDLVYISSYDHKLYAFDALSGRLRWAAPTGNPLYSSPAIAEGLVYVGSYDGKLYAFDALNGQLRWTAATGDRILSSPAIADGLVYIGSWDYKLYAFDALSGQLRWAAPTGERIYVSSPAIADGLVYIGSWDCKLYAFDAFNGEQRWAAPTGNRIYSSPAVANGLIYIGSYDGKLYVFNAITGQQLWSSQTGNHITSSPMIMNGIVYIGAHDRKLYAFSLDGKNS